MKNNIAHLLLFIDTYISLFIETTFRTLKIFQQTSIFIYLIRILHFYPYNPQSKTMKIQGFLFNINPDICQNNIYMEIPGLAD